MAETILRMYGIQKYFPGVHALDNAQLEVRAGEVMALIGENGAGKSTLMKILTGVYTKDEGTIELFGSPVEIHSPRDAHRPSGVDPDAGSDGRGEYLHRP